MLWMSAVQQCSNKEEFGIDIAVERDCAIRQTNPIGSKMMEMNE